MTKQLILVLGGARAGKSAFAERRAQSGRRVLFVATAEAGDDEMAQRIAAHRRRRPGGWDTLEAPRELAEAIAPALGRYDTVLIDCLTLWVSNLLGDEAGASDEAVVSRAQELVRLYERGEATWIVVSNEVGLGIVPPTPMGRRYRDLLGRVNQIVARRADKVYLMVAGLAVEVKALAAQPSDPFTEVEAP